MPSATPSRDQLQRALAIAEQIHRLEVELASVLGSGAAVQVVAVATPGRGRKGGRRVVSAATRAKMAAAQQARRAKARGDKPAAAAPKAGKTSRKKRVLSAAGRARIVAALKARWAAARKKGAAAPNARKE